MPLYIYYIVEYGEACQRNPAGYQSETATPEVLVERHPQTPQQSQKYKAERCSEHAEGLPAPVHLTAAHEISREHSEQSGHCGRHHSEYSLRVPVAPVQTAGHYHAVNPSGYIAGLREAVSPCGVRRGNKLEQKEIAQQQNPRHQATGHCLAMHENQRGEHPCEANSAKHAAVAEIGETGSGQDPVVEQSAQKQEYSPAQHFQMYLRSACSERLLLCKGKGE